MSGYRSEADVGDEIAGRLLLTRTGHSCLKLAYIRCGRPAADDLNGASRNNQYCAQKFSCLGKIGLV